MTLRIFLFLLIVSNLSLTGCVRNNPKPVWLDIKEWELVGNPNSANSPGFLSHNFSDVWVYADNKLIGVYEVPCRVPILVFGDNKSIRLYPTIRDNGISATKKIYPFCEPFEQYYNLTSGSTISISPKTRYFSNCGFWIEDFESSSSKLVTDVHSDASIHYETNSSIALSGKYAHIVMNLQDSLWRGVCSELLQLPQSGKEVYLEIDYRNTNPISTGLYAVLTDQSTTNNPLISVNKQDASDLKWKKIYISMKEVVSYYTTAEGFKLYLETLILEGTPATDVYIDNVRIVYPD